MHVRLFHGEILISYMLCLGVMYVTLIVFILFLFCLCICSFAAYKTIPLNRLISVVRFGNWHRGALTLINNGLHDADDHYMTPCSPSSSVVKLLLCLCLGCVPLALSSGSVSAFTARWKVTGTERRGGREDAARCRQGQHNTMKKRRRNRGAERKC